MKAVDQLATSLGRADEQPNIVLAEAVVANKNAGAVRELIDLFSGKNKALKSDALKTLYEVGIRSPEMIAPFIASFKNLLTSGDNRMVWGAMCAIDAIAGVKPEAVYMLLPQILVATEKGTVITRDHAVRVLVKLAGHERFAKTTVPLLLAQLRTAPVNQVPLYAELIGAVVKGRDVAEYMAVLEERLIEVAQASKRKRIEKVMKRLTPKAS